MAASSYPRVFSPAFECRSDPDHPGHPKPEKTSSCRFSATRSKRLHGSFSCGLSSLILGFPPNFARQLSTKARRNCSNIGVAQVVAASWSNPEATASVDGAVTVPVVDDDVAVGSCNSNGVQLSGSADSTSSFLRSPGTQAVHAGERLGRGIVTDAITTPVVNTSAYMFKNTAELIAYKEGNYASYEYGRYGNPTTAVAEEKISKLEGAESTLLMASGMCASTVLMMALVPAGGHLVTTTDCYRKTRIFIETILPNMGITATVIDPADVDSLKSALDRHNVSLFFTESPTNPYLRCVDIQLVSKLCHDKGALVCIDGTFATPFNQRAIPLGADMVLQSATKYLAGHNDVIAGCISGNVKEIKKIRNLHHVLGGVINPMESHLCLSCVLVFRPTLFLPRCLVVYALCDEDTSAFKVYQRRKRQPQVSSLWISDY